MTDPFRPMSVVKPRQRPQSFDHPPLDRLRRLGASRIVLEEVQRRWAEMSADERQRADDDFGALTDDELRPHMAEMEVECVALSVTDELVGQRTLAQVADLLAMGDVPTQTVKEALTWVGEDQARALACLTLEMREGDGAQRRTLLDALAKVLRDG